MAQLSFQGFLNYIGPIQGEGKGLRRRIGIRTPSKETVWITLFGPQVKAIEELVPLSETVSKTSGKKYLKPRVATRVKVENVMQSQFNGATQYKLGQFGRISVISASSA